MSAASLADHYALLGVSYDCSAAALASAYRARSLSLHPDKIGQLQLSPAERKSKHDEFLQLQQAYQVLRHADTRQQYDMALQAGGLSARFGSGGVASSATAGVLSFNEVDLDDLAYDEATSSYTHVCRCGAQQVIDEETLMRGVDLFPCDQCSLLIRVLFEWQPPDDDAEEVESTPDAAAAAAASTDPSTVTRSRDASLTGMD